MTPNYAYTSQGKRLLFPAPTGQRVVSTLRFYLGLLVLTGTAGSKL